MARAKQVAVLVQGHRTELVPRPTRRLVEIDRRGRPSTTPQPAAAADAWLAHRPRVEVDDELVDPVLRLPRHLGRLAVEGLRVGDSTVDLLFERDTQPTAGVTVTDVRIDGDLEVVVE
jgi:hypothetical protein